MNQFRFRDVSIVPQYAMSALNPIRKVGQHDPRAAPLARRRRQGRPSRSWSGGSSSSASSEDVLGLYPIELSGGMKQRVVMVISTLLDPSLLIADEITSALDVSTQKAVAETLVEFRDRGFVKSTIVITHDIAVLYQIADTILVMYAGKLAEKGPAEEIVSNPRHPYTRLLVSSLPEVGVRYAEKELSGIPGRPAVAARATAAAAASATAARSRRQRCEQEPPWVAEDGRGVACWEATPVRTPERPRRSWERLADAEPRPRLEDVPRRLIRPRQAHCRPRRDLRRQARRGRLADRGERQREVDDRPDDPSPHSADRRLDHPRRQPTSHGSTAARSRSTTGASRACSRTRSARTTRSSRPTGSSP